MSSKPPSDDRRDLAAEYALGLLTGAELGVARERMASDADFRAEVERWTLRLSPMLDEVEDVEPPARMWARIESAIAAPGNNVVALKRRVNVWRGISAGMTALAATLAVVLLQPTPQAPIQSPAAPMVAMVSDEGKTMTVVANWDPDDRQLVLAMAGDMPDDPGKAHELWVIPEGGTPRSLGTMADRPMSRMELADALAELLRQGATIAISVEPPGGSPTGAPTGPVIASGTLQRS
jgi:anti-sigma-K factor RskA